MSSRPASRTCGWLRPDTDARVAAAAIVAAGPRVVLVTDGAAPVRVVTDAWTRTVEPPQIEVVDTVGAGDAFGGAFLARWIGEGRDRDGLADADADAVADATRFAVRVATISCTRPGADPPTTAELARATDR